MACAGNSGEICGGPNRLSLYRYSGSTTTTTSSGSQPTSTYSLKYDYDSSNFFSEWSFFTQSDPTHGYVQYVGQSQAQSAGLINTNNNQIYMGVDTKTTNPANGRESVRLVSNAAFTHGLFIADIEHMPNACGAWPAWWLTGPNWPSNGEIDVIEGVNEATTNSITLHTSAGCTIDISGSQGGDVLSSSDCNNNNAYNGCGVSTTNTQNYGPGFNNIGGGVYAMQWTSSAIKVFFFPRSSIPSDIQSGNPNPSGWGTPLVSFNGGSGCNIDSHFSQMQIVFDTTFCGDWAGQASVWSSGTCGSQAATCQDFVAANPSAFSQAYWTVNYVKVYQ